MKKFLTLGLVILLVFSMIGCSPNEAVEEATSDDVNNETETIVESGDPVEITSDELLTNLNARKAFAMAFDKAYITDIILANGSNPVDFIVPKNLATDENGDDFRAAYPDGFIHYDVALAKDHWNMAKEELGFDTVTVEFLTYDSETSKKISEFIQGQLQENLEGLNVVINQQPFKNKLQLAVDGEFDIEFAGWSPDYPDPMTFLDMWVTGGGHNSAGYNSPIYDENIMNAKNGEISSNYPERWALLQETEKTLLLDDAAIIPLYQKGIAYLEQSYISGIQKHAFGGDYTYKYADTDNLTNDKKELRLATSSDIPSMDTNKATDSVSFEVMSNVLEGLYSLGENDVPEPGVAKSHEVSEDGLTYTFKLREDSVWSNGTPVTAHDFVYSWKRLVNPETASEYAYMAETAALKNAATIMKGEMDVNELGVKALDDYTLEVQLEVPLPYFIKLMTFGNFYPVNEAFVSEMGDTFGTTIDTTIYNGPFKLTDWELGYAFGFEKNEAYWNADIVNLDRVSYRIIKDTAASINLYETGEIDRTGLSGEFVEQFIDDLNYNEAPDTSLFYIVLNIGNR